MHLWKKLYKLKKILVLQAILISIFYITYHYYTYLPLMLNHTTVIGKNRSSFSLPLQIGTPLSNISLLEIYNIINNDKWVKSATVRRILPNKIHIEVTEYIPFAIWDKTFIIDLKGHIITNKIKNYRLLSITGKEANTHLYDLVQVLGKKPLEIIKEVEYINKRRWNIKLQSNLLIKLPDHNFKQSWQKALEIIEKNDLSKIKILDMRVADKIFYE